MSTGKALFARHPPEFSPVYWLRSPRFNFATAPLCSVGSRSGLKPVPHRWPSCRSDLPHHHSVSERRNSSFVSPRKWARSAVTPQTFVRCSDFSDTRCKCANVQFSEPFTNCPFEGLPIIDASLRKAPSLQRGNCCRSTGCPQ